jgi:hypothetical protein
MFQTDRDALRVDVPVGFLLPEPREILVSVDRPSDAPLSIRLRLVPAEMGDLPDFGELPPRSDDDTPAPTRRLSRNVIADGYPEHDVGGGD